MSPQVEAMDLVSSPVFLKCHLSGLGFDLKACQTKEQALEQLPQNLPCVKPERKLDLPAFVLPTPMARNAKMQVTAHYKRSLPLPHS